MASEPTFCWMSVRALQDRTRRQATAGSADSIVRADVRVQCNDAIVIMRGGCGTALCDRCKAELTVGEVTGNLREAVRREDWLRGAGRV